MFKNVAAKFIVFAFDTTNNTAKTGDAANITAYVNKDYAGANVLGDTSATEIDSTNAKGYYLFDAAQAETNADCLMISAKSATANIAVIGAPAIIYTRPTTGWLAPTTAGRTLVVDANGLADANMVKAGPTGSGTAQTAKDIGGAVPAAAAGASGGLLISGSNSGTTTFAALTVTGATTLTGNVVLSDGLTISAPSTGNRAGLDITGNGTGAALKLAAGATGKGIAVTTTAGDALSLLPTAGSAIVATGNGTSKHGIIATGGTAGTSDGISAVAGTGGVPIRGDITGNITGTVATVTTVTNQLTAAAIATGVWQDATAGDFTTASSIGKALYISNVAPGGSGGHMISGSNAGTTTLAALTVTGATTLTGAVAGTNASNDLRINGIVPGVANGLFIAGTNAATTITTALTTTFTGNVTGSVASVTGAVGSVAGNVVGNVSGNVTGTIGGLTAAALKDFFDTDSATTYASAVAGSVVKEIADNAGGSSLTAASIADEVQTRTIAGVTLVATTTNLTTNNDKTGYRLSATGVDDVLDEVVEGTTTLRQSVRLSNSALAGKASGLDANAPKYRDLADSKDRISATTDANGNRSAVTTDVT